MTSPLLFRLLLLASLVVAACTTKGETIFVEEDCLLTCPTKECPKIDIQEPDIVPCPVLPEVAEAVPCQLPEVHVEEVVDTAEPEPDTGEEPVPKLEIYIATESEILSGMATIGAVVSGGKAVMGVEFYVDDVRMDTDFIPPFNTSVNTTDFKDGFHLLSVFTADQYGQNASDSKQITFDNTPPKLLSYSPSEGTKVFFEDGPLHLKLEVDDPSSIKNATFRANGLLVAQFFQPPFEDDVAYDELFIDINALPKNVYLQFEVTDYLGQMSTATANVTVLKRHICMFETLGEIWAPAAAMPDGNIVFGNMNNKLYVVNQECKLVNEINASGSITVGMAVNPSNGYIYYGSLDGYVHAVTSGGSQAWSFNLESAPGGGIVYRNGTVYVTSFTGKVLALSEGGGGVQWQGQLPDYISSTPEVGQDGTVYVGCQDGALHAVQNGSDIWQLPTGDEVWGSPLVGPDQTIYFGSNDGWVYAPTLDGKPKWVEEVKGQIWGKPLFGSDGGLYVASTSKYVSKMDPATGMLTWATKTEGLSYSSPVEGPTGDIYIGTTAGNLFCLDPEGGQVKWTYPLGDTIHATPLLVGKKLFVGSTNRKFYGLWADVP